MKTLSKTAALFLLLPLAVSAQAAVEAHVGHVTDGWNDTPDGVGLLPAAIAEANVAASHAGYAMRDLENLDAMKGHAKHVLHAVDPSAVDGGPGAGYGVIKAARGAARHIELAAGTDGAPDGVKSHATHVATSARNTVARGERIVELAGEIAAASTAAAAAPLVREMAMLADALVAGVDANGDGRIGWQEGEGGLAVAETHAGLLKRAAGM